jgi:N,N-dimethylformamidase
MSATREEAQAMGDQRRAITALTVVPGAGLEGYSAEPSYRAGDQVMLMASGCGGPANFETVRLVHGDPHSNGPGYQAEPQDWGQPPVLELEPQPIDIGSFVRIPYHSRLTPTGDFTLALWALPTRFREGWHALAAMWSPGRLSYGLFVAGSNSIQAAVSLDGKQPFWALGREPVEHVEWQFLAMSWRADSGVLSVHQIYSTDTRHVVTASRTGTPGPVFRAADPLYLGAIEDPQGGPEHAAHFSGRMARPMLLEGALADEQLVDLAATGLSWAGLRQRALGAWDLSREISTERVVSVVAGGLDGQAVNAPARGVTGPDWRDPPSYRYADSPAPRYRYGDAPERYDAVHLHDDDLADAGWPAAVELAIPADAKPGIYAGVLSNDVDEAFLPFVVRPRLPRSKLLFLVPTLTWQCYSSNRMVFSTSTDGVIDRNRCHYDLHSDGSIVYHAAWRKPTRSLNPKRFPPEHGAHTLASDLYVVDWLERMSYDYDVASDHDLHRAGVDLLRPYDCVILSAHPEYWSLPMLRALQAYVWQDGQRVMLLGGNAIGWVTSLDSDRLISEVRKDKSTQYEHGLRQDFPHESQHSTDGVMGQLNWTEAGFPVWAVLGTQSLTCTVGQFSEGEFGFVRTPESFDPAVSFVFDGVDEKLIGAYGLNLGSAAAYEGDNVPATSLGYQGDTRILAVAKHERVVPFRDRAAPEIHIALTSHGGGGMVFAAASITWTGSLSTRSYQNGVSTITRNVLDRFLDPNFKLDW